MPIVYANVALPPSSERLCLILALLRGPDRWGEEYIYGVSVQAFPPIFPLCRPGPRVMSGWCAFSPLRDLLSALTLGVEELGHIDNKPSRQTHSTI